LKIHAVIGFACLGIFAFSFYWWMVNRYQPKKSIIAWATANNYKVIKLSPLAPYFLKFYDSAISNRIPFEIYFNDGDRIQRKVILVGGKISGGLSTAVEIIKFRDK